MDFDTPYQPYYGVPNNPPPQLPDTSGARGQQAVWRIAHSLPPGDQHSYSLNDGNAFPWQRSVSDLPARTEAFDQDAFESLQDRSTLICQGTNSSIPPGMSDFYQSLNPLDERNAMLWQGTGLTVPAGTRVFDQHASQPLNLNFDANYQFTGGDLGGHAYLPQSIERLPDLHHDYFEIATMTGILPETSTIPQNSGSTQSLFYTGESAAQSQQLPLDGTTIGHLSTLPQISSQASWENTETIYGDYNNLEVTDEIFDPYHGLVYDLALEQTREQLQSEAMHMTLSNNPSQGDQSATQGKSPEETRICGTKRKAPDLERERKRHRIPDLKSSDGAMDVFEYSLDHLSIEVSRKKAQGPRNNVVCFLCRIRQKKVSHIGL
jgi:hypothetical protein